MDYIGHLEVTCMVKISVSQLKARLSEHLRRVKGGEEVIVTERGRAIAVLSPVPPSRTGQAELDALVEAGLARRAKRRPDDAFWARPRGEDAKGAVLEALLRERREGR
jgi:prevent-host-death family protein